MPYINSVETQTFDCFKCYEEQLQVLLNSVTAVELDMGSIIQKSQPARRESESAVAGASSNIICCRNESCSDNKH